MTVNDPVSAARPRTLPDLGRLAARLPVRPGEDPWSAEELSSLTESLVAEIDRLTAELAKADADLTELLRNSGDGAGDDQADSGSTALEREHELTLVNNARDMLNQTSHALGRIAAGTFGTCESCGSPIGKARLQAFPRAVLCVTCKQREERR